MLHTTFESFKTSFNNKPLNENDAVNDVVNDVVNDAVNDNDKDEKPLYEYDCLMLDVVLPDELNAGNTIDEADLYTEEDKGGRYGLETDPHVTIMYGLHNNEYDVKELEEDVKAMVSSMEDSTVNFNVTGIGIFENEKYDVVKYDVESADCNALNEHIQEVYPFTSDYPDYKAHMTIAYVKKGEGSKYVKTFEEPVKLTSNSFTLSLASTDEKTKIHFTVEDDSNNGTE